MERAQLLLTEQQHLATSISNFSQLTNLESVTEILNLLNQAKTLTDVLVTSHASGAQLPLAQECAQITAEVRKVLDQNLEVIFEKLTDRKVYVERMHVHVENVTLCRCVREQTVTNQNVVEKMQQLREKLQQ